MGKSIDTYEISALSPCSVKRFFHTLLCLMAALHLVGGHWGVLQMVAWARMVADYSEGRGLMVGVKETFDGEHACPMCKKIAAGKQQEQSQQLPLSKNVREDLTKWFSISPSGSVLPQPSWEDSLATLRIEAPELHSPQWDTQPPVPPPRRVA